MLIAFWFVFHEPNGSTGPIPIIFPKSLTTDDPLTAKNLLAEKPKAFFLSIFR